MPDSDRHITPGSHLISSYAPALLRIVAVTVTTARLDAAITAYSEFLDHRVTERGVVSPAQARAWGCPAAAGARCVTLQASGEKDTFVRLVEDAAAPAFPPLTTHGWAAFEIIVGDVWRLAEKLEGSPFRIIGEPRPLQFLPTIVAMQAVGPSGECLYFTMETATGAQSLLPIASGPVGRTFIAVCAGPDFGRLHQWYLDSFHLIDRPVRAAKVRVVQQAQGLSPDETVELCAVKLRDHGNLIELDGYRPDRSGKTRTRPRTPGHLPPGNAIVTFEVADLAPFVPHAIAPPVALPGAPGNGRRTLTLAGPAGELLELVETGR